MELLFFDPFLVCQIDLREAFRTWDKKNLGGLDATEFQA